MSENIKLSERAKAVLAWMQEQNQAEIGIRQASLAELLGCSRTSIYRALKRLKEAGLISDTQKRHEQRYKIYRLEISPFEKGGPRGISVPEQPLEIEKIPPNLPFPKLIFDLFFHDKASNMATASRSRARPLPSTIVPGGPPEDFPVYPP